MTKHVPSGAHKISCIKARFELCCDELAFGRQSVSVDHAGERIVLFKYNGMCYYLHDEVYVYPI